MTDAPDIVDVVVRTPSHFKSLLCQFCASCGAVCAGVQCQKYCLSKASYQLGLRSAVRRFTWSTILMPADTLVAFDRAVGEVIGRYVRTTVLQTSNSLMPAAGQLMVLNRLLMLKIGVNLCMLVLRPRCSMVLQGSRIMSAPGIL